MGLLSFVKAAVFLAVIDMGMGIGVMPDTFLVPETSIYGGMYGDFAIDSG